MWRRADPLQVATKPLTHGLKIRGLKIDVSDYVFCISKSKLLDKFDVLLELLAQTHDTDMSDTHNYNHLIIDFATVLGGQFDTFYISGPNF